MNPPIEEMVKNKRKYFNRTNLMLYFGGFLLTLIYCTITGVNPKTTAPVFALITGAVIGVNIVFHKK